MVLNGGGRHTVVLTAGFAFTAMARKTSLVTGALLGILWLGLKRFDVAPDAVVARCSRTSPLASLFCSVSLGSQASIQVRELVICSGGCFAVCSGWRACPCDVDQWLAGIRSRTVE